MKICHVVTEKEKYVRGLSPTSFLSQNRRVCLNTCEEKTEQVECENTHLFLGHV